LHLRPPRATPRSGWILRLSSLAGGVEAALDPGSFGGHPRHRLARSLALALRRPGFHGIGLDALAGTARMRAVAMGAQVPLTRQGDVPAVGINNLSAFRVGGASPQA